MVLNCLRKKETAKNVHRLSGAGKTGPPAPKSKSTPNTTAPGSFEREGGSIKARKDINFIQPNP